MERGQLSKITESDEIRPSMASQNDLRERQTARPARPTAVEHLVRRGNGLIKHPMPKPRLVWGAILSDASVQSMQLHEPSGSLMKGKP